MIITTASATSPARTQYRAAMHTTQTSVTPSSHCLRDPLASTRAPMPGMVSITARLEMARISDHTNVAQSAPLATTPTK